MGNCVGSKGIKKDPKLLTEEEIKLLLDNTRLTRAQIVALHRNFLKECPTGKLTKKDFIKLFKEVHPSENKKEKADKFCEYVFKVIDHNNLGYISFQDFVLCFSLTSDGDFRQKCEFAFKLYDLDKDGKISKKEMTQVLTALYDLSGITDRKKENAPAKKVEDIIRKINATYQPPAGEEQHNAAASPSTSAPSSPDKKSEKKKEEERKKEEAKKKKEEEKKKKEEEKKNKDNKKKAAGSSSGAEDSPKKSAEKPKKEKPAKPAKAPKLPEFITKEQFIDACTKDETLKKLFVDSIFCNNNDGTINQAAEALSNLNKPENVSVSLNSPLLEVKNLTSPVVTVNFDSNNDNNNNNNNNSNNNNNNNEPEQQLHTSNVTLELKSPSLVLSSSSPAPAADQPSSEQPAAAAAEPQSAHVDVEYHISEQTEHVTTTTFQVNAPEVNVSLNNENSGDNQQQPQSQ